MRLIGGNFPHRIRILALTVGFAGLALPSLAQLSPGPLSEPHADLDSILQCTSCHALGLGRAEFRCTDCHTEIRDRIAANRGYHPRVAPAATGNATCVSCHAEHFGRDFEILAWPTTRERFDHTQAGYVLEGRHAEIGCDDCHTTENMVASDRAAIRMDPDRSMLGLDTACLSCHDDEHRGQFENDCTSCHSLSGWTPAPGFTHEETRFPLRGVHSQTSCEACHPNDAGGRMRFSPLAFGTCENCHEDPHAGAFDAACNSCHNATGWANLASALSFDHQATRFPLEGAHIGESCAACHQGSSFAAAVPHDRCMDCHEDYHQGQFAARTDGGDCSGCHDAATFDTSTFTADRHTETRYPLLGMHVEVTCESCHAPAPDATADYHPPSDACLNCHQDAHDDQFTHLSNGACESCHTVDGFRPSTYSLAQHTDSRFPLEGAHRAVLCFSCHTPMSDSADAGLRFRIEDRSCVNCHADPHGNRAAPDLAVPDRDCETCHTSDSWDVLDRGFDHDRTEFALLGAHVTTACEACHTDTNLDTGVIRFDRTPTMCVNCHDDIHQGQFGTQDAVTDCESCHETSTWTELAFDHERDSTFSLEGAHAVVACATCHLEEPTPAGRPVRIFKGTPTECAACH